MLDAAKEALKRVMVGHLRRQDAARRAHATGGFGGLPPELWGYEIGADGNLRVESLDTTELSRQFGSPLHVVNLPWLRKTHDEFLRPFQSSYPNVHLATSYKTNPIPAVLKSLHDLGTYAEVISEFELWLAGRVGLAGERIIVNGPGKTRAMLSRAVDMAVKVINVDGPGEIEQIAAEAQRVGRRQPVGVRVITSIGWSSQFGLSIETGDALAAYQRILQSPWLVPTGVHLHIGTGLKDVDAYLQAIRQVLDFGRSLRESLGVELGIYDLGGGFGVPTVRGTDLWDDRMVALGYPAREAIPDDCPRPSDYAERIAALFLELLPRRDKPAEIVLEPGRAITSGAQALLLKVIALKDTGGRRKLILDGGKNITMPLGWETHKILPATGLRRPFDQQYDLYGPLCHPGDVVARHLTLPPTDVGDVLAIMDAGAYFIPNQMNFSNPRPAVVTVAAGRARQVRRPESFEDVVRLDDFG